MANIRSAIRQTIASQIVVNYGLDRSNPDRTVERVRKLLRDKQYIFPGDVDVCIPELYIAAMVHDFLSDNLTIRSRMNTRSLLKRSARASSRMLTLLVTFVRMSLSRACRTNFRTSGSFPPVWLQLLLPRYVYVVS